MDNNYTCGRCKSPVTDFTVPMTLVNSSMPETRIVMVTCPHCGGDAFKATISTVVNITIEKH